MDQITLLKKLLDLGYISRKDNVLAVCGSNEDDEVFKELKFTNYLITSAYKKLPGVKKYKQANAQNLPFRNNSFDIVIVNAGLHHCDSPHLALTEMYRVAKKALIVHESQDSILVRLMVRLNLNLDYEISSIAEKRGGLNDTAIPNFIYRWTKRDVIKTLNSYDPTRIHKVTFFSGFRFYPTFLDPKGSWGEKKLVKIFGAKLIKTIIDLIILATNKLAKNQGNDFAFIVRKDISPLQPWITNRKKSTYLPGRLKLIKLQNKSAGF